MRRRAPRASRRASRLPTSRAPRARRPLSRHAALQRRHDRERRAVHGLPVLTCMGATMAGRVGGSQLHALGLPELVDDGPARAYEDTAAPARPRSGEPPRCARRLRGQSLHIIRCSTWRDSRATWRPRSGPSSAPETRTDPSSGFVIRRARGLRARPASARTGSASSKTFAAASRVRARDARRR